MIPTTPTDEEPRRHLFVTVLPPELASRIRAAAWEIAVLEDHQVQERQEANG